MGLSPVATEVSPVQVPRWSGDAAAKILRLRNCPIPTRPDPTYLPTGPLPKSHPSIPTWLGNVSCNTGQSTHSTGNQSIPLEVMIIPHDHHNMTSY